MRTTLDIDDDLLAASKELSRSQGISIGKIISNLARKALAENNDEIDGPVSQHVWGFKPFPARGGLVTNELIDKIRDEEGI